MSIAQVDRHLFCIGFAGNVPVAGSAFLTCQKDKVSRGVYKRLKRGQFHGWRLISITMEAASWKKMKKLLTSTVKKIINY